METSTGDLVEVIPEDYSYVFNPYREPVVRVKASGNLLRPTEEALLVEWKHDSAVRVALDDKLRSGHAGARGEVVLLP